MPSVDAQFVLGLVGHQVPIQAFFGFLHNTMNIQVIRDEIRLRGTLGTHVPAYLDLYQAEIQTSVELPAAGTGGGGPSASARGKDRTSTIGWRPTCPMPPWHANSMREECFGRC